MYTLQAEKRDAGVKAKQLRKAGKIPACIYGADHKDSIQIQLAGNDVTKLLKTKGEGALISLDVAGEMHAVLLKSCSRSAVDRKIEEMSFQALVAGEPIKTNAALVLENKDKAAGTVEQLLFELPYKALPAQLVETVEVDMTGKKLGDAVHVGDLALGKQPGVELLLAPDTMIAHVIELKVAPEVTEDDAVAAPAADAAEAK